MTTVLDSDRALDDGAKDQFGFVGMAKQLAPSIVEASKGDGMVIGLEGRWGSGKTSLLNFLRAELEGAQMDGVHTITIAPWLNGDSFSLVSSLLEPMIEILEQRGKDVAEANGEQVDQKSKKMAMARDLLREYGPKTARGLSAIAKAAELIVPGASVVSEQLEAAADFAESKLSTGTNPAELKQELVRLIQDLDVSFVVILDDLDRLEPTQAVEVVRLVRSVADFPKVAYLMCYDREILAHALKVGLNVEDGDLFLQKIVQLTFNIPLPEPFDLRSQFLSEAIAIYNDVMEVHIDGDLLKDLKSAIDREGGGLSTPREVKLALNGLRFVFPQVKDDVYFPDFCRLQLIKTTHFKLYKWLENYLSVRSVLVTGDASVSEDERKVMGRELKTLLPADSFVSVRSIYSLKRFIPGLADHKEEEKRVFNGMQPFEVSDLLARKRLGSPLHYRFYFALTGPKNVMPDREFNSLLELAEHDVSQLTDRLKEEATRHRHSGRTWLEHIFDRLDDECISGLSENQLAGFAIALSDAMDFVLSNVEKNPFRFGRLDNLANVIVRKCLKCLGEANSELQAETVRKIAEKCEAINWFVGEFIRGQLFHHGRVGDRKVNTEKWGISADLLDEAIDILKVRLEQLDTKAQIPSFPDVLSYLYGWRDISQDDQAVKWVREYSQTDEGFLWLLRNFRGWTMSDRIYRPLSKDVVSTFLEWDDVVQRLESLKDGGFSNSKDVLELQEAIKLSGDF